MLGVRSPTCRAHRAERFAILSNATPGGAGMVEATRAASPSSQSPRRMRPRRPESGGVQAAAGGEAGPRGPSRAGWWRSCERQERCLRAAGLNRDRPGGIQGPHLRSSQALKSTRDPPQGGIRRNASLGNFQDGKVKTTGAWWPLVSCASTCLVVFSVGNAVGEPLAFAFLATSAGDDELWPWALLMSAIAEFLAAQRRHHSQGVDGSAPRQACSAQAFCVQIPIEVVCFAPLCRGPLPTK